MNNTLLSDFVSGVRSLQGLAGETLELDGIPYPCTAVDMLGGHLELVEGGAFNLQGINVCVLQTDLPDIPLVNTPTTFRDLAFRVKSVNDFNGILWQLLLEQQFA